MAHSPVIECGRCGTCCLANMIAQADEDDLGRWEREGRRDILEKHSWTAWAGDRLVVIGDEHLIFGCPFLEWRENRFACSIYETRPRVCRDFQPGSSEICPRFRKKHGERA